MSQTNITKYKHIGFESKIRMEKISERIHYQGLNTLFLLFVLILKNYLLLFSDKTHTLEE